MIRCHRRIQGRGVEAMPLPTPWDFFLPRRDSHKFNSTVSTLGTEITHDQIHRCEFVWIEILPTLLKNLYTPNHAWLLDFIWCSSEELDLATCLNTHRNMYLIVNGFNASFAMQVFYLRNYGNVFTMISLLIIWINLNYLNIKPEKIHN